MQARCGMIMVTAQASHSSLIVVLPSLQVCDAAVQKVVKELGGLDIIVNNAGAGVRGEGDMEACLHVMQKCAVLSLSSVWQASCHIALNTHQKGCRHMGCPSQHGVLLFCSPCSVWPAPSWTSPLLSCAACLQPTWVPLLSYSETSYTPGLLHAAQLAAVLVINPMPAQ
jgi:NAD(P)-dependent dehydrogenase (short-subunit alcohol dehydrogenase family)